MTWTVNNFMQWSVENLSRAGIASPRLDGEILLAGALHARREELYANPHRVLKSRELAVSRKFIERRMDREPVSYILGRREFWSLDFKVSPDVLVPRPETECLIQRFLDVARTLDVSRPLRILDIGTGCGILAVVAILELPRSRVTAVDICPRSLEVAKENARAHAVGHKIHFLQCDLFPPEPDGGPFDFILSNPPYIESSEIDKLTPEVRRYEPRHALDGGVDGLDFYRRIVPGAWERLSEGGSLILEIGWDQARPVSGLLQTHGGFETPLVNQDYSGRDRVISARKRPNG